MTLIVNKWGNSLGIRFPKTLVKSLSLEQGSSLEVTQENLKIILSKTNPLKRLDEKLAKITEKNRHGEIEWGGPVGNEIW